MLQAESRPSPNKQGKSMRRAPGGESRPDPKPTRRRRLEGGLLHLVNKDPETAYVWAHKTETCGRPHYEAIGYKVCITTEGGVRSALKPDQKVGEEITTYDVVLMEIPLWEKEEIERDGEFGDSGQKYFDTLQNRLFKPNGQARKWEDIEAALGSEAQMTGDANGEADTGRY